ncbi:MAG TPA: dihydrodipicolinate synthase family protein [Chloroflexota bacterium]
MAQGNEHAGFDPVGVIVPMITPLSERGEIDGAAIVRLVAHLLNGGIFGIFVLGSSGEGPWLSAAERERVVECAVRAAGGHLPILAGALQPGSRATIEDARMLAGAGADAIVVTSPYYFGADAVAQVRHIETVAATSPLPVVLYNIPQMTHSQFSSATVQHLAGIENVVAIKDSAGDWPAFEQMLALRAGRPGFRVLEGAERQAARAALAGADGIVPGLANVAPRLFVRLFAAARHGDRAAALEAQAQVDALWHLHGHGYWLASLKEAAAQLGFGSGATVGHGSKLPADARAAIAQLMQPYANEAVA